jgi:hypothetical protein
VLEAGRWYVLPRAPAGSILAQTESISCPSSPEDSVIPAAILAETESPPV